MAKVDLSIDGKIAFSIDVQASTTPDKPTPVTGGSMLQPKNQKELLSMLQGCADNGGSVTFDGSIPAIDVTSTIEVNVKSLGDAGPVFNFNGLRLNSKITDGVSSCIRFKGESRGMQISGLNVYGGGYDNIGCGHGIELVTSGGAMWLCTFRNLFASWCRKDGIRVQGDVFESSFYDMVCKDNFGNGMSYSNIGGIVSNCMMYGTNLSRNVLFGLDLQDGTQSVDMFGGSFVQNGLGGINGPIRSAFGVNGENTGLSLFTAPSVGYPSKIIACNMSSDGRVTHSAQPNAQVSQYVITPSNAVCNDVECYVTPYGSNPTMKVRGP